tara:strand:+ start:4313 stop:5581 length:1269 start_codon:yes stop_codon:yes gene_type:complete
MKRNSTNLPFFDDPRIVVLLFVLAVCSGYFTYNGAAMILAEGAADWTGNASALIFAIASSTCIFILWTAAPVAAAKLETPWMRSIGLGLASGGFLMVAALSSWLNVAGLAGDSALGVHMNSIIASYENALEDRYSSAQTVRALQPDLKQAKAKYLARRNAELLNGAYTGRRGPGTTVNLLFAISERFDTQDKAIDAELARTTRVAAKARGMLKTMREVTGRPGDPAMRMEHLARAADGLRALLGEIGAKGMLSGVRRTLQGMPGEIDLQVVSAKTARGRKAQRAALTRIKTELGTSIAGLESALERHIDAPLTPIPTVQRLNAIEAVWRYPLQHAPYWAGGIALDFTPSILLFYAMLISYARGRRGLFVDATADLTVRDLKKAQHALEILRDSQISHEAVRQTHDELTGGPDHMEDSDDERV